eukprot:CAMPEP_0172573614 /NCGR_PEP_ID=MMETSP1067-20121228/136282_1 /TAXON_ID=265564 ORGANISM="Thalassiosira punctigera, Strain Tpunct2005C2" /NCGR_SAMPLE_ID=MMETSP1067 /ASSEMBLY_ACC=CAM_ASM_000444 /LENGTH=273 /DNA_ID=CAMNT_0013366221 /DNA_START=628 /DNA_END=1451 /DNA_ORIENTATION=-
MAAAMCLLGHVVDDLEVFDLSECLLRLPMNDIFRIITGDLGRLEGCYLYYDIKKHRWIRSGKTSGDGDNACFDGRGDTHKKNASSKDEMREHPFYVKYPMEGVENVGAPRGYFNNLNMYCGMAFDLKSDVTPLCTHGASDSLFVWSEEKMNELNDEAGYENADDEGRQETKPPSWASYLKQPREYLKDNDKDERDSSLRSLCTHGASDSLYVWSEEKMNELKRRGGNLQRLQLDAVSYLWEICHDLLLEKNSNVSISPGFESLGLRLNEKRGR